MNAPSRPDDERLMLHNLLDALDHLYDEREFAPWWTWMLLVATKEAMRDTPWFEVLADAERDVQPVVWTNEDHSSKCRRACEATGALRLRLADFYTPPDSWVSPMR